jgi:ABC-type multidrug transport system, ATPase and permease components
MFKVIRLLFLSLPTEAKRKFIYSQLFFVLLAIVEVSSVVSIAPFIALVVNVDIVHSNQYVAKLYSLSGASSELTFLYYSAALFVFLFLVNTALQLYAEVTRISFARNLEVVWISRLLQSYLYSVGKNDNGGDRDAYFSTLNSEVARCCDDVALPILEISSKVAAISFLVGLLLFVSLKGALLIFGGIASVYVVIFYVAGPKIKGNGLLLAALNKRKLALLADAIDGVREVRLYRIVESAVSRVSAIVKEGVIYHQRQRVMRDLPYHVIEVTAFSLIVLVVLLTFQWATTLEEAITRLSVLCLAGYKLIPKFQNVYRALTRIKGMQTVFYKVCTHLVLPVNSSANTLSAPISYRTGLSWLALKNITFGYNKELLILQGVTLNIDEGEFVGLVGASGAGKSTLCNIVLGFLAPTSGALVSANEEGYFLNRILYVSSHTHIFRGTIKYNITFDRCVSSQDEFRLERILHCVGLSHVISDSDEGLNSDIGYEGSMYSSGQVQRIGFARALFHDPVLLVLDEATNALDYDLQQSIISNIRRDYQSLSILGISHRLDMRSNFDSCYRLSDGRVTRL